MLRTTKLYHLFHFRKLLTLSLQLLHVFYNSHFEMLQLLLQMVNCLLIFGNLVEQCFVLGFKLEVLLFVSELLNVVPFKVKVFFCALGQAMLKLAIMKVWIKILGSFEVSITLFTWNNSMRTFALNVIWIFGNCVKQHFTVFTWPTLWTVCFKVSFEIKNVVLDCFRRKTIINKKSKNLAVVPSFKFWNHSSVSYIACIIL